MTDNVWKDKYTEKIKTTNRANNLLDIIEMHSWSPKVCFFSICLCGPLLRRLDGPVLFFCHQEWLFYFIVLHSTFYDFLLAFHCLLFLWEPEAFTRAMWVKSGVRGMMWWSDHRTSRFFYLQAILRSSFDYWSSLKNISDRARLQYKERYAQYT